MTKSKEPVQARRPGVLDESVALSGYHGKAAIRVFRGRLRRNRTSGRGRPRTYTNEVKAVLIR